VNGTQVSDNKGDAPTGECGVANFVSIDEALRTITKEKLHDLLLALVRQRRSPRRFAVPWRRHRQGEDFGLAVLATHALGCNPGGEVLGYPYVTDPAGEAGIDVPPNTSGTC